MARHKPEVMAFCAAARAERALAALAAARADLDWLANQPGELGKDAEQVICHLADAHSAMWDVLENVRPDKDPERHWRK